MSTPQLRALVCGSRNWTDRETLRAALTCLPPGSLVLHGDNGYSADGKPLWGQPDALAVRGADKLAGAIARELGHEVLPFTPDWGRGKRAGPERNARMLAEGKPDLVLAFHRDWESSRGTRDMLLRTHTAVVPRLVFTGASIGNQPLTVVSYCNYRGKFADRRIRLERIYHGVTEWHPEPGWLLYAWDYDKQAYRDFALSGVRG